jgi:hypothetical protein
MRSQDGGSNLKRSIVPLSVMSIEMLALARPAKSITRVS